MTKKKTIWGEFALASLFEFQRGDFNSFGDLDPGEVPTLSRSAVNNAVEGHFVPPKDATIHKPGVISVSTTSGDAFVQLCRFISSDKVVLLVPRQRMEPETLFFVAFSINYQKWRYSYGRSCFERTLKLVSIYLPKTTGGGVDIRAIKRFFTGLPYWKVVRDHAREKS